MTIANGIIDSFGALKAALTTHLVHSRWVGQYANATVMFETTANHRLRVRPMEAAVLLTTVDGAVPLPADYVLWRTVLHGDTTDPELDYVHAAYLDDPRAENVFSIKNNYLYTRPIDDSVNAVVFHYYAKIPTITNTDDNAVNWLLLEHPNVYLFGVLIALGILQRNGEMATAYKTLRDEMFAEIIQTHALTTGATSPQVANGNVVLTSCPKYSTATVTGWPISRCHTSSTRRSRPAARSP